MAKKQEMNAVITKKIDVSPELMILQVASDGWEMPDFEPGQFAVLGLLGASPRTQWADLEEDPPGEDELIRRAYSIASSSEAKEYMEFYINLVRDGALTTRLFALNMGDRVWLGKKVSGTFTLNNVPEKMNVVMAATGTGLAPYISMMRTHLPLDGQRRLAVLHGARHSWDLGYRSELSTMQQLCSNFSYICFISRPTNEVVNWNGLTGYVQDQWKNGELAKAWGFRPSAIDTHIFLCGNPSMCEDMLEVLAKDGFRENTRKVSGQVHVERYW